MQNVKIDWSDFSASLVVKNAFESECYFLKGQFEDGHLLAFYTHSPRGCVHDQQRGWVLIKPNGKRKPKTGVIIDRLETYADGPLGFGWREWRKNLKIEHGKMKRFLSDITGGDAWKMSE